MPIKAGNKKTGSAMNVRGKSSSRKKPVAKSSQTSHSRGRKVLSSRLISRSKKAA